MLLYVPIHIMTEEKTCGKINFFLENFAHHSKFWPLALMFKLDQVRIPKPDRIQEAK
jgi:hypothetical protein